MSNVLPEKPKVVTQYDVLETKLDHLIEDIKEIKDHMKSNFVSQDQFAPVKLVVYGMCSVIMLSVIGALMVFVLRGHSG